MPLLANVRCFVGRHEPERRKVKWNGATYVSHCRHCGVPIERHGHKVWREVDEQEVTSRLRVKLHELAVEADKKA